jgi:hypothetical protein
MMIKQMLLIFSLLVTAMIGEILMILQELFEGNPGITAVTNGTKTAKKVIGMTFKDVYLKHYMKREWY